MHRKLVTRGTRMLRLGALLTPLVVPAGLSFGASQRDWNECVGNDIDTKIGGCSRIISNQGEVQSNRARAFNYRANAERSKHMFDAAVADYGEAIRLNPEYAFSYNGRGLIWQSKGKLERAIADFDEAIRLNPKYPKTYNNRGRAWLSKGELDRAIGDFNEAIALEPKYSLAYFDRGLTWWSKGELQLAIGDFSEAIALEPDYAFAYFNRGVTWRAKGEVDRAIYDFNKAISLDPKFEIVYFNRALTNVYAEGGPAKALADLNQASELDPKDPYFALWNDIVRQRMGLPSVLMQMVTNIDMTNWPAPVLRVFVGQQTPAELLAAASDLESKGIRVAMCEANFYSAVVALRQRREEDARRLYKVAADRCPITSIEWYAANAELKNLDR
jgi:lipoprotein NlpI